MDLYKWLLEQFMKANSNKQPLLVLTNQDATLKQAVESVFSQSKHRLCMWHIMKKLPKKLSVEFLKSTNFKKRFNKLVWDIYIERHIFERSWELLMNEFNLEDEKWFKDIFENKEALVPASFNDFPRCGVMKTTSRSEKTENFFLYFMMNCDAAIKKQHYTQCELDRKTKGAKYSLRSPCMIEQHAAKVYTSKVFFLNFKKRFLKEGRKMDGRFLKLFTRTKNTKHVFRVLMDKIFNEIPEEYILRRWTNDVTSLNYQLSRDHFGEEDVEVTKLVNEVFLNVETALDIVRHDKQKLACLAKKT
uniref:Protein FAR1-RELATED SEQUENCE n=1 Tax=Lactuca sativa TaxID=4236 RepID=A0A9R1VY13_LACSA|nr:hypothetical protein LSAT_V11C400224500 [Lactuca sativa]